jgi:hypothetical protein
MALLTSNIKNFNANGGIAPEIATDPEILRKIRLLNLAKGELEKNPYKNDFDWFKYKTTSTTTTTTTIAPTTTTIAPTTTNNTTKYLLYVALGIIALMIFKKKK